MNNSFDDGSHYFALPVGTRLHEFEIDGLLGHGGFGITYRATDTLLQEEVAIKEFLPNELAVRITDATVRAKSRPDQLHFEVGLKSFLEEARMMARLRHPRIVHVRRFFEAHGTGYIVLDYERGDTLSEYLNREVMSEHDLRVLLFALLDGLEVIHDRALLHRDLKPSNVMRREDGSPVIIDFGAARDFRARHSRSVTAIATAGYSPPEQYGVGGQQGPWTDLYALGAIAYRVISGSAPVDSLRRLRNDPLVPAATIGAGKYDASLLSVIDWMMQIDEERRPSSVAEVREALRGGAIQQSSSGSKVAASPPATDRPSVQADEFGASRVVMPAESLRRRGRYVRALSICVMFALAFAGAYIFYRGYSERLEKAMASERRTQDLERVFADAGSDREKLEKFLRDCAADCPTILQAQAVARLDGVREQERLHNEDKQKKFAESLDAAGSDQVKLKQIQSECNSNCTDAQRMQVETRLEAARQRQTRAEETAYRNARGSENRLQEYIKTCVTCAHKAEAIKEMSDLAANRVLARSADQNPLCEEVPEAKNYVSSDQFTLLKAEFNAYKTDGTFAGINSVQRSTLAVIFRAAETGSPMYAMRALRTLAILQGLSEFSKCFGSGCSPPRAVVHLFPSRDILPSALIPNWLNFRNQDIENARVCTKT